MVNDGDVSTQGDENGENDNNTQSSPILRGPNTASITDSPTSSSSGGFGGSMMMIIAAVLGGVVILIVVLLLAFRNRRRKEKELAMTISPKDTDEEGYDMENYDMEEAISESACSGMILHKKAPSHAGSKVSSKASAKYSDSTGSMSRSTGLERLLANGAAVRSLLGLGPDLLESGTRGSGQTPQTGENSYEDDNDDSDADLISLGDLAKEPEVFPMPNQQILRPTMTAMRNQSARTIHSSRNSASKINQSKSSTMMSPDRRSTSATCMSPSKRTDPGLPRHQGPSPSNLIAPGQIPARHFRNSIQHTAASRNFFSPEVNYANDFVSEDERSMATDQSWHQDQAWNPDDNELTVVPRTGNFAFGKSS